jgi:hypothetical protein
MHQLFFGGLLLAIGMPLYAQTWLVDPKIRVCENLISCDDERHIELTQIELEYVESILHGIPSGATESVVTKYFGWDPIHRSPATDGAIGKWRGPMYRLTWGTERTTTNTARPHVDVYFINGRAFMLKWWFNGMKKMVQLTFAG